MNINYEKCATILTPGINVSLILMKALVSKFDKYVG